MPLDLDLTTRRANDPNVTDGGVGTAPIVDMGAYERDPEGESCAADLAPINDPDECGDGNGDVGAGDLGELLANWGPCPGGTDPCCADLFPATSGDDTVGPGDLGELLANWGPCDGCGAESEGFGGGNEIDIADAIWIFGFDTVDDCVEWCINASDEEAYAWASDLYEYLTD